MKKKTIFIKCKHGSNLCCIAGWSVISTASTSSTRGSCKWVCPPHMKTMCATTKEILYTNTRGQMYSVNLLFQMTSTAWSSTRVNNVHMSRDSWAFHEDNISRHVVSSVISTECLCRWFRELSIRGLHSVHSQPGQSSGVLIFIYLLCPGIYVCHTIGSIWQLIISSSVVKLYSQYSEAHWRGDDTWRKRRQRNFK